MKLSVHQPWDPLKLCIVGRTYSPEFYQFITDPRARSVMERIASECEEDYQKLISLLESFNVEVVRPELSDDYTQYQNPNGQLAPPPMCPRDYLAMIGEDFYVETNQILVSWDYLKGWTWPDKPTLAKDIPLEIQQDCATLNVHDLHDRRQEYQTIIDRVSASNRVIFNKDKNLNTAMIARVGKDLYFGTESLKDNLVELQKKYQGYFPDYRCHMVNTGGHLDGTFAVVAPGLVISSQEIHNFHELFPDWEIVYVPYSQLGTVQGFSRIKQQNAGKWWVPGEEENTAFTEFVSCWINNWVGYVEETLFDVNLLVIDPKNVAVSGHNETVFRALDRYGITPHIVNFRHRFFWDGGLHCITSDLHREGTLNNYFPKRG